jgi:hypothetical protein
MKKKHNILLFYLLVGLQAGTNAQMIVSSGKNMIEVSKQSDIRMLAPILRYESIMTETALRASDYRGKKLKNHWAVNRLIYLSKKGFR